MYLFVQIGSFVASFLFTFFFICFSVMAGRSLDDSLLSLFITQRSARYEGYFKRGGRGYLWESIKQEGMDGWEDAGNKGHCLSLSLHWPGSSGGRFVALHCLGL